MLTTRIGAVYNDIVILAIGVDRNSVQINNASILILFLRRFQLNSRSSLVVYRQGRSTIFRMPIYPMLNQWNANPMTPNPGL